MQRPILRSSLTTLAALAALLALAPAPGRAADAERIIPDLKVETYTLPNGLSVILHEDHTIPFVGVNIWYKVASKDEKPGRTGFAHLFEHLMFQGSQHHDTEYFGPLEQARSPDQRVDQHRPDELLRGPADQRPGDRPLARIRPDGLPPAGPDQAKLDNQRDVVKNERRQRVDNVPYGHGRERLRRVPLPVRITPTHHSVIGSMADLSAASLGRRLDLLPDLLQPQQRQPLPGRRHQPGRGPQAGREVLRPDPPRPRGRQAQGPTCRPWPSRRPSS